MSWNFEDLDAILGQMIQAEDEREPLQHAEWADVRATIALSLAGEQAKARELFVELQKVRNIR